VTVGTCVKHRLEAAEEQMRDVVLALVEALQQVFGDPLGVGVGDPAHLGEVVMVHEPVGIVALQLLAALLADGDDLHRLALAFELHDLLARQLDDRGVEAAAQTALGGADQQQMHLVVAGALQQRRRGRAVLGGAGEIRQHAFHLLGIGTRGLGGLLGAAKLRRRDHLHRLGDLPRRLDRVDAVLEVLEARHPPEAPLALLRIRRRSSRSPRRRP
jgi:hypothetical protein